jgi:hypothetical protein
MRKTPYESHRGQPKGLLKRSFIRKGGDMRKVTIIVLAIAFLAGSVSIAAARSAGPGGPSPTPACTSPRFLATDIGPQELWAPNNKPVTLNINGAVMTSLPCTITDAWYVVSDGTEAGKSGNIRVDPRSGRFQVDVDVMASRSGKDKDGKVYTISLYARNSAGLTGASQTFFVKVAHDQRKK